MLAVGHYQSLLLRPGMEGEYCDRFVCLSVCLSVSVCPRSYLWSRWTDLHDIFLCRSPVALTRSSSVCSNVLPVLWMTSRLAVMAATKRESCTAKRLPRAVLWDRDGVECLWMPCLSLLCCAICTAYLSEMVGIEEHSSRLSSGSHSRSEQIGRSKVRYFYVFKNQVVHCESEKNCANLSMAITLSILKFYKSIKKFLIDL